jgi:hypothetical protein
MKPYDPATSRQTNADRLDAIRLSPSERRTARASMRQAELIVDMLIRANDDLRKCFEFVARGIGALARRRKVSAVGPKCRAP